MRVVFFAEAFNQGTSAIGDIVAPIRTKGDGRANKNDGDWCPV
jgi:hypothetical protein